MKLNVQHRHFRNIKALNSLVRAQLAALAERREIEEAIFRLEEQPGSSPRCRVHAHLVTPGPDLVGEASDHSLPAALQKVMSQLHSTLSKRERNREGRVRRNRSAPSVARGPVCMRP